MTATAHLCREIHQAVALLLHAGLYCQKVFYGEYASYGFERKELSIHNHIVLPLLYAQGFDFRKEMYRDKQFAAIRQICGHHPLFLLEVQFPDSNGSIFVSAHNHLKTYRMQFKKNLFNSTSATLGIIQKSRVAVKAALRVV